MNLFLMLLLLLGIWRVGRGSMRYEAVKRIYDVLLPLYALVVFLLAINNESPNPVELALAVIAGAILGWIQTLTAQIQSTHQHDRHNRPVVKVRRGWAYLLGWVAIFLVGFALEMVFHGESFHEFIPALAKEVKEELFHFTKLTDHGAWTIYALSGISGLVYVNVLRLRYPEIKAALRDQPRQRRHN
ncbi:hypothetical protein [Lacticaseibacillus brantae]|uniref:Hydrophobic protein n=1 Tax=Lacticaseibacillus brantae DSM 23927 TaxID=1423727 RepID=A0A0R2AZN4_9LACO|nr:hypothetical protein [Lacticaseibacillus brantae]KRM72744.1 hypothetical protein FC34_GL000454 [Lacticaseibacillus brantae DSM 23927]